MAGMGYLRHEMVEAMAGYRRFVREDVVSTALDAAAQADALALAAAATEVDAAYEAFRARWAERAIAEHWSEYRLSAIRMMNLMTDGVRRAAELPRRWVREAV